VQARCQEAYFRMINEQGGIAGRQIKYIYYDAAFNPSKTVEQVRRLIEERQRRLPVQHARHRAELGGGEIHQCAEGAAICSCR